MLSEQTGSKHYKNRTASGRIFEKHKDRRQADCEKNELHDQVHFRKPGIEEADKRSSDRRPSQ